MSIIQPARILYVCKVVYNLHYFYFSMCSLAFLLLFYSRVVVVRLSPYCHLFYIIIGPEWPLRGHEIKKPWGGWGAGGGSFCGLHRRKGLDTLKWCLRLSFQWFVTFCPLCTTLISYNFFLFSLKIMSWYPPKNTINKIDIAIGFWLERETFSTVVRNF